MIALSMHILHNLHCHYKVFTDSAFGSPPFQLLLISYFIILDNLIGFWDGGGDDTAQGPYFAMVCQYI